MAESFSELIKDMNPHANEALLYTKQDKNKSTLFHIETAAHLLQRGNLTYNQSDKANNL